MGKLAITRAQLFDMAKGGMFEELFLVLAMLKKPIQSIYLNSEGYLYLAMAEHAPKGVMKRIAKIIMEQGDQLSKERRTILTKKHFVHFLIQSGCAEELAHFLNADASLVDVADERGDTLLHYACFLGDKKMASLLLENGANINAKNAIGETPLHKLDGARTKDDTFSFLLENGADPAIIDDNGVCPIAKGLYSGNQELLMTAIEENLEVNKKSILTAILDAGDFRLLRVLEKYKPDLLTIDMEKENFDPGVIYFQTKAVDSVEKVLHFFPDYKPSYAVLKIATENRHKQLLSYLYSKANAKSIEPPSGKKRGGGSIAHVAARTGDKDILRYILQETNKKDINTVSVGNMAGKEVHLTPLGEAIRGGHDDCVKVLREEFGASINGTKSSQPFSHPLSVAILSEKLTIANYLLSQGACSPVEEIISLVLEKKIPTEEAKELVRKNSENLKKELNTKGGDQLLFSMEDPEDAAEEVLRNNSRPR